MLMVVCWRCVFTPSSEQSNRNVPYRLITKPVLTMFFNYHKEGTSGSGSLAHQQPQCFFLFIFHCRHFHLYSQSHYSFPLGYKYLYSETGCRNSFVTYLCTLCIYCLCNKSIKKKLWISHCLLSNGVLTPSSEQSNRNVPYRLITKPVLTMFFKYRIERSSGSGCRTAFRPKGTNRAAVAQDRRLSPPTKFGVHRGMPSQPKAPSVHLAKG